MNLFLVTSALDTQYSLFPLEERIQQTIETVLSIRKYAPDSHIVLVEGGKPLDPKLKSRIAEYFNHIFDYTDDPVIKMAQSPEHYSVDSIGHTVKTPCEAYMLMQTSKQIPAETYNRIFKISGRYVLTEQFDLNKHTGLGEYVFLPRAPAGKMNITEVGSNVITQGKNSSDYSEYCYETTFYSFCGSILSTARQNFETMFNKIIEIYSSENYIDVETAMYLTVDHSQVLEVSPIGISGQLGMAQGLSINK
jgi:hypothetical protein